VFVNLFHKQLLSFNTRLALSVFSGWLINGFNNYKR